MAIFKGTNQEFRRYIGPRLRNLVQQLTKSHKARISACEYCGSKDNLESAHVKGRDRNEIIDLILKEFTTNGVAAVDLITFEEKFKQEHQPLEKSILILCRDCHKKYDSTASLTTSRPSDSTESSRHLNSSNGDDYLPITLDPPDPAIFKSKLLRTKLATIETSYSDGRIESKQWNATRFSASSNVYGNLRSRPEYRSGQWQAKGIVKVHVRITEST